MKAIAAILEAPSYEKAIPLSGVCRQTFFKWLKMPHFRAEVERRLNERSDEAMNKVRCAAIDAVDTLRGLLGSANEGIRLRAAQSLYDYHVQAREFGDLLARVDAIEKRLETRGNR